MDSSRVLIAVILSLGLIFAYQELVLKHMYPPQAEQPAASATAISPSPSGAASPGIAAGQPSAPGAIAAAAAAAAGSLAPAEPTPAEQTIKVDSDLYAAEIDTRGARITGFQLKRYTETAARDSGLYQVVPKPDANPPLGVIIARGGAISNDAALVYTCDAPADAKVPAGGNLKITCVAKAADGTTIQKVLTFSNGSYAFAMDIAVDGGVKPEGIGLALSQPLAALEGFRDIPELQADVKQKVITETEAKLKKGVEAVSGPITYAGFGDRYFLTAYLPAKPSDGILSMTYQDDQALARMLFAGTSTMSTRVYMGPKLLEALEAVDPSLNKAIDFGWFGILALPFLRILKLFHLITPNYGWDIILLTVGLRILLLPMSIKSQRSMMKMQRLAPQMERIREKFKDDQQRIQQEMVDLYKRNHVNPLGGCLPMALQFPIFIGLYEALLNAIDLRHAPFIWWIRDLSAPDCFPISWMPQLPYMHCHGIPVLVLAMGASTFLQQWMSPTSPDPNQQRMMMLTPIIFTVMFVNFPAGLSLYYFASNVLGVIQQVFLNREFKAAAA